MNQFHKTCIEGIEARNKVWNRLTEKTRDLRKLRLDAVLLEYEDLRDEIKRRMDQRTYISYFAIAMTIGALGLYGTSNNPYILVATPLILIYWLFFIDSSYSHHSVIMRYIREKIEGVKLPLLIGKVNGKEGWIYWETYYAEDRERRYSSRFWIYIVSSWIIFVICGLVIYGDVPEKYLLLYWIGYGAVMIHFSFNCWIYIRQIEWERRRKIIVQLGLIAIFMLLLFHFFLFTLF